MDVTYAPIGVVRSPYGSPDDVPTPRDADVASRVELDEAYADGLDGLDEFSHVVVLAHLDGIEDSHLRARPPHADGVEVGVFASRSPHRPNPIAQSVVRLDDVDGTTLHVNGLDLVDGTPVLDVKPYVGGVDEADLTRGWLEDLEG
ncbi:tRNA (N6-threonylcarbamoyladenosine(37)-N6)-methyltransferase TrmO [Halomicrococcus gelatinilyticus]|uniref:tRNA (N6-threonylcarbamoyladenosine(37)-N6)-methyltransferase TrmO n=1 Tax=Halomicrococcus gelatinilyticus TaxID=1702103 RepID=UPI002E158145